MIHDLGAVFTRTHMGVAPYKGPYRLLWLFYEFAPGPCPPTPSYLEFLRSGWAYKETKSLLGLKITNQNGLWVGRREKVEILLTSLKMVVMTNGVGGFFDMESNSRDGKP